MFKLFQNYSGSFVLSDTRRQKLQLVIFLTPSPCPHIFQLVRPIPLSQSARFHSCSTAYWKKMIQFEEKSHERVHFCSRKMGVAQNLRECVKGAVLALLVFDVIRFPWILAMATTSDSASAHMLFLNPSPANPVMRGDQGHSGRRKNSGRCGVLSTIRGWSSEIASVSGGHITMCNVFCSNVGSTNL